MLVQFRVNESQPLYKYVERLSKEGNLAEQIRLRLTAFETLSELVGEDDPLKVISKVSGAWHLAHAEKVYVEKEKEKQEEDLDDDIMALAEADY